MSTATETSRRWSRGQQVTAARQHQQSGRRRIAAGRQLRFPVLQTLKNKKRGGFQAAGSVKRAVDNDNCGVSAKDEVGASECVGSCVCVDGPYLYVWMDPVVWESVDPTIS
ncbi:hypothetical protein M9H77_09582 [Catharanthus roseus]|uniref:Uncharacterized protein n=1 Tax=Catharanthus roseus TaxID=4058 RepID=A0ACC0C164_CATRO|nr:hypothetical protein M9H77_09582 [Catharanthus roseus]